MVHEVSISPVKSEATIGMLRKWRGLKLFQFIPLMSSGHSAAEMKGLSGSMKKVDKGDRVSSIFLRVVGDDFLSSLKAIVEALLRESY